MSKFPKWVRAGAVGVVGVCAALALIGGLHAFLWWLLAALGPSIGGAVMSGLLVLIIAGFYYFGTPDE